MYNPKEMSLMLFKKAFSTSFPAKNPQHQFIVSLLSVINQYTLQIWYPVIEPFTDVAILYNCIFLPALFLTEYRGKYTRFMQLI